MPLKQSIFSDTKTKQSQDTNKQDMIEKDIPIPTPKTVEYVCGETIKFIEDGPYAYVNAEKTAVLAFFSLATMDSEGKDPCVLTVDATSKQVCGLQNALFAAQVIDLETGAGLDTWGYYTNELTTIVPYTEGSTASVKNASYAKLPFSSVVVPVNKFRSIKSSTVSLNGAAVKSVSSVKPTVVESYTREAVKFQLAKANIR